MSKDAASRRLSSWSRLGAVVNDEGQEFVSGGVCKIEDMKGQYRIIGIDSHRSGLVELIVRKEVRGGVGKVRRVDLDEAIYVAPPYRIVY